MSEGENKMAHESERPPLTAEAFDAMIEQSPLVRALREELAWKASATDVAILSSRVSQVEAVTTAKLPRR